MEDIKNHDRYFDPPNYPTRSRCDWCEEMYDNEDLKYVDGKWLCGDCEAECMAERKREDEEE